MDAETIKKLRDTAKAEVLWALRRWQESMTAEEMCATIFDAPGLSSLIDALDTQSSRTEAMRQRKDEAYRERNKVVRLIASLFPSGIKKTDIPGWDEEWHWCVYIDLPTGQVSWHIHISEFDQFADLPPYQGEWDGHDTPTKYARVAALSTPNPGDADGWSGTDNAAPGTEKYALQRALEFIEGLTADPLLMGDDIEMTLDDVQSHARIELDSIIRQRRAALEGR